jgi:hypothetical protein
MRIGWPGAACHVTLLALHVAIPGELLVNHSLKCPSCGLVQFAEPSGSCSRCELAFPSPARVGSSRHEPPSSDSSTPGADRWWPRHLVWIVFASLPLVGLAIVSTRLYRATVRAMAASHEVAVQAPTPVERTSFDGVIAVTASSSFSDMTNSPQTGAAVLALVNGPGHSAVAIYTVPKTALGRIAFLSQVPQATPASLHQLENVVLHQPRNLRLANHAAIEISFFAKAGGVPSRGLYYVIDGNGCYHILVVWCATPFYARHEAMLRGVVASTRLLR